MDIDQFQKRRNPLIAEALYQFCGTEDAYDDCRKVKNAGIFESEQAGYEYSIFFQNDDGNKFALECNESAGVINCSLFTRNGIRAAGMGCECGSNITPQIYYADTDVRVEDSTYKDLRAPSEEVKSDGEDGDAHALDAIADALADGIDDVLDAFSQDVQKDDKVADQYDAKDVFVADITDAHEMTDGTSIPDMTLLGDADDADSETATDAQSISDSVEFTDVTSDVCVIDSSDSLYTDQSSDAYADAEYDIGQAEVETDATEIGALIAHCDPDGDGIITDMFPDPLLLSALQSIFGSDDITVDDMLKTQGLYLKSQGISDISGLECFSYLTSLNLSLNPFEDLTPLSGLIYLKNLQIAFTTLIHDLSPLTNLTDLEVLSAHTNNITDISPLAGMVHLKTLMLHYNNISDISPLSFLCEMQGLYLSYNSIEDISPLACMNNLLALHIYNNNIEDISPLAGLSNFINIFLNNNKIKDVQALSGKVNMTQLEIAGNQIVDLGPLSGLSALKILNASNNLIADLSGLFGLQQLDTLSLEHNSINDITPLAGVPALKVLYLTFNDVEDVSPLSLLTNLTELALGYNQIFSIEGLQSLASLALLYLNGNQIPDITPLLENEGLAAGDVVYLGGNPIPQTQIDALKAKGVDVQ